jgi:hypothetical protein
MSRYSTFRVSIQDSAQAEREVLVICQGLQKFEMQDLVDAIAKSLEHGPLPDDLIVLVPEASFAEVVAASVDGTALASALLRGSTIWGRLLLSIDGFGRLRQKHRWSGSKPLSDEEIPSAYKSIVAAGLKQIALRQDVVKYAPPGCVFAKPSSDLSEYFLLAADLLHSEPEIVFVANAALDYFGDHLDEARTIYVDTMAIQPLARAMVQLARLNGREVSPAVESFHSYEGLKKLLPESPEALVCLISASTSGSLARRFVERTRCSSGQVITCLEVVDQREHCGVLVNAAKVFSLPLVETARPGATRVQLAGEYFASTAKPPRHVVLSQKHEPNGIKKWGNDLLNKRVISLDYMPPRAVSPRPLAIDGEALLAHEQFADWFKKRIRWSVSASTKHIVHANDSVSAQMAQLAKQYLVDLGTRDVSEPINAASISSYAPLTGDEGVVVCSAVARSAAQLVSISRDLRTFAPRSPRSIVIGVAIPSSTAKFKVALSNLTKGNAGWDYSVAVWMNIAVGHSDDMSSWDEERALLQSALQDEEDEQVLTWIELRFTQLSETGNPTQRPFLLSTTAGSSLVLRPGFIYLDNRTAITDAAVVYAIISAVLQNARENAELSHDLRLVSSSFEQVVLAPECFNRFNDGVIQACILRAAYPSELDYSCSVELSADMAGVLAKIFKNHAVERGEAALEFATALATGRLKLDRKSGIKLLDEMLGGALGSPFLDALLRQSQKLYADRNAPQPS